MIGTEKRNIRVAILDLYEGQANQGMRCIREILKQWAETHQLDLVTNEFDVRLALEVPDTSMMFIFLPADRDLPSNLRTANGKINSLAG